MSSAVTSLLKAGANAIFTGVSAEPLLLAEMREMRERNLKMVASFARFSGECAAKGADELRAKAEDCIAYALDFDARLFECLSTRRTPGEDLHFRRVAIALEHVHQELGLEPIPQKKEAVASPSQGAQLRVLWLNGAPPAANS